MVIFKNMFNLDIYRVESENKLLNFYIVVQGGENLTTWFNKCLKTFLIFFLFHNFVEKTWKIYTETIVSIHR